MRASIASHTCTTNEGSFAEDELVFIALIWIQDSSTSTSLPEEGWCGASSLSTMTNLPWGMLRGTCRFVRRDMELLFTNTRHTQKTSSASAPSIQYQQLDTRENSILSPRLVWMVSMFATNSSLRANGRLIPHCDLRSMMCCAFLLIFKLLKRELSCWVVWREISQCCLQNSLASPYTRCVSILWAQTSSRLLQTRALLLYMTINRQCTSCTSQFTLSSKYEAHGTSIRHLTMRRRSCCKSRLRVKQAGIFLRLLCHQMLNTWLSPHQISSS
mmetsp:Transcript_4387/g.16537  ORF Transcript_4387/g.16537 Transcript_4387/m.16537 type:complete len:272 (-) Transcript_4387:3002-3817(-)